MTEQEIRVLTFEVLSNIAPEAEPETVEDDEDLRDALDLDSMDFLNFVIGLHERTGIEIPESDYPKLTTFGGCRSYLAARTS